MDSTTGITKASSVSNQEGQFMKRDAIKVNKSTTKTGWESSKAG